MKRIDVFFGGMGFKLILVGMLVLAMLLPAALVRGVVMERSARAEEAAADILESWGGELRVAGPVLRIPCLRVEETIVRGSDGALRTERRETAFDLWISPENLELTAGFRTERKSRGLFSVPVFSGTLSFSGSFDASAALASLTAGERALPSGAELVLAVANQAGIRSLDEAAWDGRAVSFEPGDSGLGLMGGGLHAALGTPGEGPTPFRLTLSAQGGRSAWFLPLGRRASVAAAADWPSPSFQGRYLPLERSVDEGGFLASWEISSLSHGIPLHWKGEPDSRLSQAFFGVDFLETLDRYALAERATKHAILFLAVPFLTLFALESASRRRIHPVQYALAGMANLVFYLLLLSLAEHIPFGAAYLAAAASVSAMVLLYARSLMGGWARAWYMGPVMAASYLYLYVTLRSEDWALLIGSVGAFAAVGIVMYVSRKALWYGVADPGAGPDDGALAGAGGESGTPGC